jgi:hypothetical protein
VELPSLPASSAVVEPPVLWAPPGPVPAASLSSASASASASAGSLLPLLDAGEPLLLAWLALLLGSWVSC